MQVLTLNHVSNRGPIGIVAPVFDEVLMRVNMGKMIHNKGGGGAFCVENIWQEQILAYLVSRIRESQYHLGGGHLPDFSFLFGQ